jgi:hypothetical protein
MQLPRLSYKGGEEVAAMDESSERHLPDDTLELYAMGQLSESSLAATEEHLYLCESCRQRMASMDAYVALMKQACREEEKSPDRIRQGFFKVFLGRPGIIQAAAAAILLAAVIVPFARVERPSSGPPAQLSLTSSRGADLNPAIAPVDRPLEMNIAPSQLPDAPAYRVQIVSPSGDTVWETAGAMPGPGVSFRVDKRLSAGTYWVRVNGPAGKLLREFSLEIRQP